MIGNDFNENLRGDRGWADWWVQRLLWFARDRDVLVLPVEPDHAFLRYVTDLIGVDPDSLRYVVPSAGQLGATRLTADRLADPLLHERLRAALNGRTVAEVFALWPDPSVVSLAEAVGCASAVAGEAFMRQGGGILVNSKCVFRAVAAGAGVPIPAGSVCVDRVTAGEQVARLFAEGRMVMLKQEFLSGGRGNEILSPDEHVRPVGARRTTVLTGRAAIREHLDANWDWLSDGGRHRVVVEEYVRDSAAFYGEYRITDDGVELCADGELFYAPYAVAQIIPSPGLDPATLDRLLAHGRRLCEALRVMGYRGYLAADAIVTPTSEVLFTEWNGRVSGSTHLYHALGERVVGDFAKDRFLLDRSWPSGWSVPSFETAVERLAEAGLAYDPASRSGVLLSSAFDERYRTVMHCVVGTSADHAWQLDAQLAALFTARAGV